VRVLANIFCILVAIAHLAFLVLEMFLWDHPIGRRVFSMTPEVSASSAVLAMNQGLYNGFLAAGVLWGVLGRRNDILYFFLACVIAAGVFGAITAKPSIFIVQALPAILALCFVVLASARSRTVT
jgi:putative membrane protein